MDSDEIGLVQKINFRSWMVEQVSSGKYQDLEWIDPDQTVFKLPWTKKHYPYWEEHHEIFKAWARFRARVRNDPKIAQMPITAMKSNFRTVLNKCSEIQQMKDYHQLNLQTGNYKVYKVLSIDEVEAKRKRKRKVAFDVIEITSTEEGFESLEVLNDTKISEEWSLATRTFNLAMLDHGRQTKDESEECKTHIEIVQDVLDDSVDNPPDAKKPKSSQSTQTEVACNQVLKNDVLDQRVVLYSDDVNVQTGPCVEVETSKDESKGGFHMLLEAAELAGSPSHLKDAISETYHQTLVPHIKDLLKCLEIPEAEIDCYQVVVKYRSQVIINKQFNNFRQGFRLHYGDVGDEKIITHPSSFSLDDLISDFARLSIVFPPPEGPDDEALREVLEGFDAGLVLVSQNDEVELLARRLCQSDIFFFSANNGSNEGAEELKSNEEKVIFSYNQFVRDWFQYVSSNDSPQPIITSIFSLGCQLASKTDDSFISFFITPCAAQSILKLSEKSNFDQIDESFKKSEKISKALKLLN